MTWWGQLLSSIVFAVIIVWGIHILSVRRLQRLPEYRLPLLERLARMAVHKVAQQQGSNMSYKAKKTLAISIIVNMCKDLHAPLFTSDAMDTAIEDAFFALPEKISDEPRE
jgi:hypothetical protein